MFEIKQQRKKGGDIMFERIKDSVKYPISLVFLYQVAIVLFSLLFLVVGLGIFADVSDIQYVNKLKLFSITLVSFLLVYMVVLWRSYIDRYFEEKTKKSKNLILFSLHMALIMNIEVYFFSGLLERVGKTRILENTFYIVVPSIFLIMFFVANFLILLQNVPRPRKVKVWPGDNEITLSWKLPRKPVNGFIIMAGFEKNLTSLEKRPIFSVGPKTDEVIFTRTEYAGICNGRRIHLALCSYMGDIKSDYIGPISVTPSTIKLSREFNKFHSKKYLAYHETNGEEVPEIPVLLEPSPDEMLTRVGDCIYCGAPVILKLRTHEYRCWRKQCYKEFIFNSEGTMIEVTKLAHGTCICCRPKQMLIIEEETEKLVCSHTGRGHTIYASGEAIFVENAPFGLCICCNPRRPIINAGQSYVCSSSNIMYEKDGENFIQISPSMTIDANIMSDMYDRGMVSLLPNGIAILDPNILIADQKP